MLYRNTPTILRRGSCDDRGRLRGVCVVCVVCVGGHACDRYLPFVEELDDAPPYDGGAALVGEDEPMLSVVRLRGVGRGVGCGVGVGGGRWAVL